MLVHFHLVWDCSGHFLHKSKLGRLEKTTQLGMKSGQRWAPRKRSKKFHFYFPLRWWSALTNQLEAFLILSYLVHKTSWWIVLQIWLHYFYLYLWSRVGPKQYSVSLGSLDATQSTWVDYSAQGLSTSSEVNQLRGQLAQELQWRLVNVVLSGFFGVRNHPIYSVGAHDSSVTANSIWPTTWSGEWNPGRADVRSPASPCSPEMSSLRTLGIQRDYSYSQWALSESLWNPVVTGIKYPTDQYHIFRFH